MPPWEHSAELVHSGAQGGSLRSNVVPTCMNLAQHGTNRGDKGRNLLQTF